VAVAVTPVGRQSTGRGFQLFSGALSDRQILSGALRAELPLPGALSDRQILCGALRAALTPSGALNGACHGVCGVLSDRQILPGAPSAALSLSGALRSASGIFSGILSGGLPGPPGTGVRDEERRRACREWEIFS
jgi:hypothetical protein